MTVPTVDTIAPAVGLPSGRLRVYIQGTGYRVPTDDERFDWPTVEVRFGDVVADRVDVVSDTLVVAVVPEYTAGQALPVDVAVDVANVDDLGVRRLDERVVVPNGFRYSREDLTVESDLQWVARQLVRYFRRHLLENSHLSSGSSDYSRDPASMLTAIGELPAIVIDGPGITESKFYRSSAAREHQSERSAAHDLHAVDAPPFTADLTWDIMVIARAKTEALNLKNAAIRLFARRPIWRFPAGPDDDTLIACRLWIGNWSSPDEVADHLFIAETDMRIEALQLGDDYGLADGAAVDDSVTAPAPEIEVGVEPLS